MTERLPDDIAIIVLGRGGAELGTRLRAALPGSRLHGPRTDPADWDESYDRASTHVAQLFAAGRPIVGLCASGILIRSVAPLLAAKREEPPVVAVAEDGSVAVPLVGGHHGANALARAVAALTGGVAAITTAGRSAARLGTRRAAARLADRQPRTGEAGRRRAAAGRARRSGRSRQAAPSGSVRRRSAGRNERNGASSSPTARSIRRPMRSSSTRRCWHWGSAASAAARPRRSPIWRGRPWRRPGSRRQRSPRWCRSS